MVDAPAVKNEKPEVKADAKGSGGRPGSKD